MGLPDPSASRAVIIGVDSYETLDDLPAVANNIDRLAKLLTGPDSWGLPPEHCVVLSNPETPGAVLNAVHTAAADAEDAVLIYFAGHGLLSLQADLYLALPDSHSGRLYGAVDYNWVRHALVQECTARSRVVILDCCYSGRALQGYMSGPVAMADRSAVEGTYVMTASAETKLALAPVGEEFTAFTGELLKTLADGVPGAPDPLDMNTLYTHLHRALTGRGLPVPQQRSRNAGHTIALARNRHTARCDGRDGRDAARSADPGGPESPGPRFEPPEAPPAPAAEGARVDAWVRTRRFVRGINRLVAGGTALTVLASVLFWFVLTPLICGDGAEWHGSECSGPSDSTVFAHDLADVTLRIKRENQSAESMPDSRSVTIGLMDAMTASASSDPAARTKLLHEIWGAHLAQIEANHRTGAVPRIRLQLTDSGEDGQRWATATRQLVQMVDDGHGALRAVVGFGRATQADTLAIRFLTEHQIPVVAESDADALANTSKGVTFPGLVRVSPTISGQAAALGAFRGGTGPDEALVVEDSRQDDTYVRALREAFAKLTKNASWAPEEFTSSGDSGTEESHSYFRAMVNTICTLPAGTIYFAGREHPLREFIGALGDRRCHDRKYTVVTGPEAAAATTDKAFDWDALQHGITVQYVTAGHPDMWRGAGAATTGGSAAAMNRLKALIRRSGAADPVTVDASTIAGYDAALTAITAIRGAASGSPQKVPYPDAVSGWFDQLHGANKVEGAGGWICLDRAGNPYNKAVAVVRLDPDKKSGVFVSLAWPEGHAPAKDCPIPP